MAKKEKESTLGIGVKKEDDLSKWYTEVVQKAELIEYTDVSGCIVFRPYLYQMWEIIQAETDKKFKEIGIQNCYFPLLIPEKHLVKEQEHVKGFAPEVAWVTQTGETKLPERLAVRPTSETIMYPTYAKWIRSWRDLPLRLNQWNNVVRWEFKHPVPLMRTREFLWNEGHTVFASKEEAEAERDQILGIYEDVLKNTLAIYATKGFKSEKEKFAGAVYTASLESFLPTGKAIQGPDFHFDGQNFAKAYDIKFRDRDEKEKFAFQNTWAISTRMLGVLFMMHGDDKGLVLPPKIAPIQIIIIPIYKEENKNKILEQAKKIKNSLKDFRAELDDRDEYTPGWKYNNYELKGVPIRIEIGPKDLEKGQAVLVRRDTGKKVFAKTGEIAGIAKSILQEMQSDLYKKSEKYFKESVVSVKSIKDIEKAVKNKKLGFGVFCNTAECEEAIKEKTGAKTLNSPFDSKVSNDEKCVCGKPAKMMMYFGKSY